MSIEKARPKGVALPLTVGEQAHNFQRISATLVGGHVYKTPLRQRLGVFHVKVAILVDGGHLRALARKAGHVYTPDFIEKTAHLCVTEDETLLRVLYYDCAPYTGSEKLPVSGNLQEFKGSDLWLRDLAAKDYFAVRKGVLKFRGFKLKSIPRPSKGISDSDFRPDFEQKGVDMRIGLDIANYSALKTVDRIILVTGDTDCIPAMKHARINGLQVVLIGFPSHKLAPELVWHSDFLRQVQWPSP